MFVKVPSLFFRPDTTAALKGVEDEDRDHLLKGYGELLTKSHREAL